MSDIAKLTGWTDRHGFDRPRVFQERCGGETYFRESLIVGIQYGSKRWARLTRRAHRSKFAKSGHDGQSCRTNCGKQSAGRPHDEGDEERGQEELRRHRE